MQVLEAIAINQAKYNRILLLKNKEGVNELDLRGIKLLGSYFDMGAVEKDYYLNELVDYFLLDKEGVTEIFKDVPLNLADISDEDRVLVLVI